MADKKEKEVVHLLIGAIVRMNARLCRLEQYLWSGECSGGCEEPDDPFASPSIPGIFEVEQEESLN